MHTFSFKFVLRICLSLLLLVFGMAYLPKMTFAQNCNGSCVNGVKYVWDGTGCTEVSCSSVPATSTPLPQATNTPRPSNPTNTSAPQPTSGGSAGGSVSCSGCGEWTPPGQCNQSRTCEDPCTLGGQPACCNELETRNTCEDDGDNGGGGGNPTRTPTPQPGAATPTPVTPTTPPAPVCTTWAPVDISVLPGSGELQTQSGYLTKNNTELAQSIWRGNQGWTRTVPVNENGSLDTARATAWAGPINISSIPGSGDMQTTSHFYSRNGTVLFQSIWRGNEGWVREVPIVNGSPNFSGAPNWTGPIGIDTLPGAGDLQTQSAYLSQNGATLNHSIWRGNQGWTRTIPVTNGVPDQSRASDWGGPNNINALPGSGLMQTTNNFTMKNNTELVQGIWRGNQGWVRTVPIVNGAPQFSSCPPPSPTTPTPTLAPPTVNPPIPACSLDGWSATFGWVKSPDTRVNTYVLRINKNNDWMNSLTNPLWFLNDGSDQWILTGNVDNKKTTIIPFRQYFDWSVQSANTGDVDSWKPNPGSTSQGQAFTCFPTYQTPTGGACLDAEGFLTETCTLENFRSEYRRQYGYSEGTPQGTGPYPNLVTSENAYKAILTDTVKKELVDLLDFELWRKKSHEVRPSATPTLEPTASPSATITTSPSVSPSISPSVSPSTSPAPSNTTTPITTPPFNTSCKPTLTAPANQATAPAGAVNFSWSACDGATSYVFHYKTGSQDLSYITPTNSTSVTNLFQPNTTYQWSVVPCDGGLVCTATHLGTQSNWFTFTYAPL